MWITMKDAFLSVVADPDNPANLCLRGRVRGDVERLFPAAQVAETPDSGDYAFCCSLPRQEVVGAVAHALLQIDYGTMRDNVAEEDRHDFYFDCWTAMHSFQAVRQREEAVTLRAKKVAAKPRTAPPQRTPSDINPSDWPLVARANRD